MKIDIFISEILLLPTAALAILGHPSNIMQFRQILELMEIAGNLECCLYVLVVCVLIGGNLEHRKMPTDRYLNPL